MPETVFFRDGQLDYSTLMDKDNCLALETKSKNQRSEIIKWIKEAVKQRQHDNELYKNELQVLSRLQKHGKELSKDLANFKSSTDVFNKSFNQPVAVKDRKG